MRKFLPELSLPEIYRAIRKGNIRVQGRKADISTRVSSADLVQIDEGLLASIGDPQRKARQDAPPSPEFSEVFILETKHLLFASKPKGMLSHGPGGLDGIVRERCASAISASLSFVPGPLHRLDRNTSGLVVCSRSLEGARAFSALLREGRLSKTYLALVEGELREPGEWGGWISREDERRVSLIRETAEDGVSRAARSSYRPIVAEQGLSLLLVRIETGRTHQIRAQAAAAGHPLAGDLKYGGGPSPEGYLLHAWRLEFVVPPFDDVPSRIEAALPKDAAALLDRRFGEGWRRAPELLEAPREKGS